MTLCLFRGSKLHNPGFWDGIEAELVLTHDVSTTPLIHSESFSHTTTITTNSRRSAHPTILDSAALTEQFRAPYLSFLCTDSEW